MKRSIPVHATITPLSTQRRGGGIMTRSPCWPASCASSARTSAFAATPPATTMVPTLPPRRPSPLGPAPPPAPAPSASPSPSGLASRASAKRSSARAMARRTRSTRWWTQVLWKLAAMFRLFSSSAAPSLSSSSRRPPHSLSINDFTADFSPENEKSQPLRRLSSRLFAKGFGSWYELASPALAICSSRGPPGTLFIPSNRAVLSNASPMLSSSVEPRMRCLPRSSESTVMLCPPETRTVRYGKSNPASCCRSSFGSLVTIACASMWWTRTTGFWYLAASS
mmetsp:Transcript_117503/g.332952  ORF Transcript_117503/g.332952 Transcript_117503/m.332952 type:complete len:281 (+) Transcript_117503:301-1143(+)